jgi:hypothetical protein
MSRCPACTHEHVSAPYCGHWYAGTPACECRHQHDSLRSRIERAQPKPVRLSGPERPSNMPENTLGDPTEGFRKIHPATYDPGADIPVGGPAFRQITAKLYAQAVTARASSPHNSEEVVLQAVTSESPTNKSWSKYTPAGTLSLTITNPGAQGFIQAGKEYIVSIRLAEPGE